MMRRTSGDVKSPTKYVIEAFSSPPRRADAVRPGELVISPAAKCNIWFGQSLNRPFTVLPSFIASAVQRPNASQNARKWRRSYVDGPGALPYKPRQSRRIAAASRAAENIP
jgi:hypothetical protein